jgi:hypothetical protein
MEYHIPLTIIPAEAGIRKSRGFRSMLSQELQNDGLSGDRDF